IGAGEMVAIMGPSGSGKSTLLSCLAGLDEPDGGSVTVAGKRMTRRPEATRAALRARWIGVLLQSGNLIEHLTVAQNIAFARSLSAGSSSTGSPSQILASVGLAERGSAQPSTLSGGEAARAGIGVAIANDPPILLADERTAEGDAENERIVLKLLRARVAGGGAVLVVTHSSRVADAADRVTVIDDGRIG